MMAPLAQWFLTDAMRTSQGCVATCIFFKVQILYRHRSRWPTNSTTFRIWFEVSYPLTLFAPAWFSKKTHSMHTVDVCDYDRVFWRYMFWCQVKGHVNVCNQRLCFTLMWTMQKTYTISWSYLYCSVSVLAEDGTMLYERSDYEYK